MSAIAGAWDLGGHVSPHHACASLLDLQAAFGPDASDQVACGSYAAGRQLYRSLPEDVWDRQPLVTPEGRFCLVADVRLDEREEVVRALGLDRSLMSQQSDALLLFEVLLKWGERALRTVHGDYAFAFFNRDAQTLLLGRDTAGEKPLYYSSRSGLFAFASVPHALASTLSERPEFDWGQLAKFAGDLPNDAAATCFKGIYRLLPGQIAWVTKTGVRVERYWSPLDVSVQSERSDHADALRHHLDAAVRRRMRRANGLLGTHLSSGLDSNSVTASAALARASPILAFTSVPSHPGILPVPSGRDGDESALAAATAAIHPNIEPVIVRPEASRELGNLDWCHLLAGQPVGSLFNNAWWQAINRSATERGVTVLLTGEAGNFGLSHGRGLAPLRAALQARHWRKWLSECRALRRRGYTSRNLAAASFGGHVPQALYRRLRPAGAFWHPEFLRPEWRARLESDSRGWDPRPPLDPRAHRWRHLSLVDPAPFRKAALAKWGIEERDPTNDRQLVEFCFSLPWTAFLAEGGDRPVLRAALSERVSELVLANRARGVQSADWHLRMTPAAARAFASRLPLNPVVDHDAVLRALACWPSSGSSEFAVWYRYTVGLMRALSVSHFAAKFDC